MRQMAATALRSAGYDVVDEAADAEEALDLISSSAYDVMVVDYYMPGMDGLQLVSHVRSLPEVEDISILMVTSERDCCVAAEAREAGADAFLSKPVHPARLHSKVRELMAVKRGGDAGRVLLRARQIVEATLGAAIVVDRNHDVVAGNDVFWDEVGSGVDDAPLKSCAQTHAEGVIPPGCPLVEVERTGLSAERVIDDRGVATLVSVSVLDLTDDHGDALYLHVTSAVA
jgi:CheY-like chemotaxis protein